MTEPMKTATNVSRILDEHLPPDGVGTDREQLRMNLHREISKYAAQQVAAERERIKMYMKGRLDKCESEIKDTSVDSDARRILQGHKYELVHILKEIDIL